MMPEPIEPHFNRPISNPFTDAFVADPNDGVSVTVNSLHEPLLKECFGTIDGLRHNQSMIISGSSGSGKTHFVSRLFREVYKRRPHVIPIYVRLDTSRTQIWHHLRRVIVKHLIKLPNSENCFLDRLIASRRRIGNHGPTESSLTSTLVGLFNGNKSDQFEFDSCGLCYELLRVIPSLYAKDNEKKLIARNWLLGEDISGADRERLGLNRDAGDPVQREQVSKQVVLSLLRLAGVDWPIVFCFDQIEGLQSNLQDDDSLREFAKLVDQLHLESRARLFLVSLILSARMTQLLAAAGEAYVGRLAMQKRSLPPLTWNECFELTQKRLESVREAVSANVSNPLWPLCEVRLRKKFENSSELTPRKWIQFCAAEFAGCQTDAPSDAASSDAAPSSKPQKVDPIERIKPDEKDLTELTPLFLQYRHSWKPNTSRFKSTFEKGVPFLNRVLGYHLNSGLSPVSDLDLELSDSTGKKTSIALLNEVPSSLWRKLDRLLKKRKWNLPAHLLLFHAVKISQAVQLRLDKLQAIGVETTVLEPAHSAELEALVTLFAKAQSDELPDGKFTAEDVEIWAAKNLDQFPACKELGAALFSEFSVHDVSRSHTPHASHGR